MSEKWTTDLDILAIEDHSPVMAGREIHQIDTVVRRGQATYCRYWATAEWLRAENL